MTQPIDDIRDIQRFYERDQQDEDQRLIRHQLEHDLTWRFLDQYLPSAGSVLELGSASGRYTVGLAQRGYKVTTVDLSAKLTERARAKLAAAGLQDQVRQVVGDARDLSQLPKQQFDAVLIMGPLYHLIYESDRLLVLNQVFDLVKAGGTVFSAFISRLGILGDLMKQVPEWIEQQSEVRSIIEQGCDPEHWPEGGFRGYFAKVDEIAPLHERVGFETIIVAGVEPAIAAEDESYNVLEGARRTAWLDLLYEISVDPSIVGASRHLLYIGKKS